MSIQDILFLIGWYLFVALVIACVAVVLAHLTFGAIPYEKRHVASENLRKSWGDFTMQIGLAIIGEREVPEVKRLKAEAQHEEAKSRNVLRTAIAERDNAIDNWKIELQHCRESSDEIERLRVDHNNAFGKLNRKYELLRKRYNALRDRTISKTPKHKAKAKTKR